MANTTLSNLDAITAPTSSDLAYIVQSSTSKKATLSNFSKGIIVTNLDVTGLTSSQLLRLNSGGTALESSGKTVPTGDIVGTSDTQTLTNKTINGDNNTISNLAHGSEVDNTTTSHGATGAVVGTTNTQTLTNKRITKRVTTITSNATPTVNTDNTDVVTITALALAITSMTTNLSGTPTNFQTLIYRILDNGSNRAITWGAKFQAMGIALPTTTVASKVLTVGLIYDTVDAKWGAVASVEES